MFAPSYKDILQKQFDNQSLLIFIGLHCQHCLLPCIAHPPPNAFVTLFLFFGHLFPFFSFLYKVKDLFDITIPDALPMKLDKVEFFHLRVVFLLMFLLTILGFNNKGDADQIRKF